MRDWEAAVAEGGAGGGAGSKQLAEACLVVSVLEPRVKRNLMNWFVPTQLKEYTLLFAAGEEVSIVLYRYHLTPLF